MANNFSDRPLGVLSAYWLALPQPYRVPILLTTCTAVLLTPFALKHLAYTPTLLPPPTPPSAHPLHLTALAPAASSTLALPSGRTLSYAIYGSPHGKPVISLHGILGSRLESALFDADAKALGIRIIAPDRPGYGRSSPDDPRRTGRTARDHATQDVAALVEHLGLEEFAVLGTSAGGVYALACAATLPAERLKVLSVVTGLGLVDMSQAWPRWVVWLNQHLNLRWFLKRIFLRGPAWDMELGDEERLEGCWRAFDMAKAHPADVETARRAEYWDWVRLFLCSAREALAQGEGGFLDDSAVLSTDPGFRVEDIRADLPVQLWCGTDDTNVSPKAGEETAQRLRSVGNGLVELHMMEGETHGSKQVKYRRRVLQDLLRAWES